MLEILHLTPNQDRMQTKQTLWKNFEWRWLHIASPLLWRRLWKGVANWLTSEHVVQSVEFYEGAFRIVVSTVQKDIPHDEKRNPRIHRDVCVSHINVRSDSDAMTTDDGGSTVIDITDSGTETQRRSELCRDNSGSTMYTVHWNCGSMPIVACRAYIWLNLC